MTNYAELFVLRTTSDGKYPGFITVDAQIHVSETPDNAWVFRTHDGAVTHALKVGEIHGKTPEVLAKFSLFNPSPHLRWNSEG